MDFDEYDYLEKAVENPDLGKEKGHAAGNGNVDRSDDKSAKRRSEDNGRESDRRSKRSKSESEGRERDWERSSSRHRSTEERHRSNRERDREERRGKDRDRERDREDRERDRDGGRDREREPERERERERRSGSRSERYYSEHDRDRERSRDRELRERERELRERDRESRRYREKKEDVPEPEADPERDQRTVFAYQLPLKADERDVYEFFSRAGKVRDVRLIMDRNSRRSKGVGYIEFYDAMSVPMAIALSGQPLLGQPVMVKPSEAEKNLAQSTSASGGAAGPYSGGARRLYVGNLHFNMTEDQLRQVFEPFGQVELVQLPLDPETGHCKGFGFIQFTKLEDAKAAQSLNGQLEIAGRTIKVSAVTDHSGLQDAGANASDFDDDDGGGLALNACSRALLMQKLDRSGPASTNTAAVTLPTGSVLGVPPVVQPMVTPLGQASVPALAGLPGSGLLPVPAVVPQVDSIGVPSECLLLKNMFDPKIETEPDFDLDIKEDVQEESAKFGTLKHIFVDKNTAGFVYLRFETAAAAVNAQRALHGRWFAGKMITATFLPPQTYEAKFPTSK